MFDPREKIALFIDGANLYAASRSLGFDIDYRKSLKAFQKRGYLLRALGKHAIFCCIYCPFMAQSSDAKLDCTA